MLTQKANFKILEKQIQRGIGYDSPAFRYNLFANSNHTPIVFARRNDEAIFIAIKTKSIFTTIGFIKQKPVKTFKNKDRSSIHPIILRRNNLFHNLIIIGTSQILSRLA